MVEGSLLDPPNLNDSPSIEHREGSDSCRALPSRWHPAPTRRWTECLQFADLEKRVTDIDRFSSPRPHSTSGPDLTSTPGLCVCLPFPQATNAPTLPAPTLPAPAGFSVSCSAAPPPPPPPHQPRRGSRRRLPGPGHGARPLSAWAFCGVFLLVSRWPPWEDLATASHIQFCIC